jgi:hypothetical protein
MNIERVGGFRYLNFKHSHYLQTLGPHTVTQRLTLTVGVPLRLRLCYLFIRLVRMTSATAPGSSIVELHTYPDSGDSDLLYRFTRKLTTVEDYAEVFVPLNITLDRAVGAVVYTSDDSTGGTVSFRIVLTGEEFM